MDLPRIYQNLGDFLKPNKALIIYGPRQIGKTTLLTNYLKTTSFKYKLDSGDNLAIHHVLGSQDFELIKSYAASYDLIAIDEAQKIPNIGLALKILVDQIPGIRIIATGSSSFELAGQIGEPLTGRKKTLNLYPIAQVELLSIYNRLELHQKIEEWLIFGGYPEIITARSANEKKDLLQELVNSYLLKDILSLDRIKHSKILLDLLRLLAFQIGSEVSLNELASHLQIDSKTVARYLDLLEKSFIIFSLRGFSRNLRKEVYKKAKYYFYDNGVRNAVISNFNTLDLRNDIGALWENFLFVERFKKRSYQDVFANIYFWRTWDHKEIDLIEEREGKLFGYEFKYGNKMPKAPKDWIGNYPQAGYEVINQVNYLDFIL